MKKIICLIVFTSMIITFFNFSFVMAKADDIVLEEIYNDDFNELPFIVAGGGYNISNISIDNTTFHNKTVLKIDNRTDYNHRIKIEAFSSTNDIYEI